MALTPDWQEVDDAFGRLEVHAVLAPTVAAMRRLAARIRTDPAFAQLRPQVSLANLLLSPDSSRTSVCVGWQDDGRYTVAFLTDPGLEFSDPTTADEEGIIDVLRGYVDRL